MGMGRKYNLKVVIKGDTNTGKTALFNRLQGHKFSSEYVSTSELQSAHIHWSYKATEDVVKTEVWDVVDKPASLKVAQQKVTALKISNTSIPQEHSGTDDDNDSADAIEIDVYRNTHAVVFMYNPAKRWTFDYVLRESKKVPTAAELVVIEPVPVIAVFCAVFKPWVKCPLLLIHSTPLT